MTTPSVNPKARPVFIAALPREIASLVSHRTDHANWRADRLLLSRGIHLFEHPDAIVVCAGMGANRASLAIEAALALGPASELVSVGLAGACIHRLHVGDVFWPDVVVDVKTGARYLPWRERGRTDGLEILATVAAPAGIAEKQRLSVSYFASAVDMEAAAVARIAEAHGLPFCTIKAISDEANFELPDLAKFTTANGQLREAAFALHVALRPTMWRPVLRLARGSKLAVKRLNSEILEYIAKRRASTR